MPLLSAGWQAVKCAFYPLVWFEMLPIPSSARHPFNSSCLISFLQTGCLGEKGDHVCPCKWPVLIQILQGFLADVSRIFFLALGGSMLQSFPITVGSLLSHSSASRFCVALTNPPKSVPSGKILLCLIRGKSSSANSPTSAVNFPSVLFRSINHFLFCRVP